VLLNDLLGRVSHRDWIAAKIEAGTSTTLPVGLTEALFGSMRTATGRHPESRLRRLLGILKAFSLKLDPTGTVSFGVEVDPERGIADSGRIANDLVMRALARIGGEEAGAVSEIANTLGRPPTSDISVARNELINNGLVYAPERGLLAFTVPGMSDFIERQP
jgi:hypothetical protein